MARFVKLVRDVEHADLRRVSKRLTRLADTLFIGLKYCTVVVAVGSESVPQAMPQHHHKPQNIKHHSGFYVVCKMHIITESARPFSAVAPLSAPDRAIFTWTSSSSSAHTL